MRSWTAIIVTFSFLAIAVFGTLAMNNGAHDGCIASAARTCAAGSVFAFGSAALFTIPIYTLFVFVSRLRERSLVAVYFQKQQSHFWAALHEKRDPALLF